MSILSCAAAVRRIAHLLAGLDVVLNLRREPEGIVAGLGRSHGLVESHSVWGKWSERSLDDDDDAASPAVLNRTPALFVSRPARGYVAAQHGVHGCGMSDCKAGLRPLHPQAGLNWACGIGLDADVGLGHRRGRGESIGGILRRPNKIHGWLAGLRPSGLQSVENFLTPARARWTRPN